MDFMNKSCMWWVFDLDFGSSFDAIYEIEIEIYVDAHYDSRLFEFYRAMNFENTCYK